MDRPTLQPPFDPSVDLVCHPSFTATNLSYRFPIFETSATALCGSSWYLCDYVSLDEPLWLMTAIWQRSNQVCSMSQTARATWELKICSLGLVVGNPPEKRIIFLWKHLPLSTVKSKVLAYLIWIFDDRSGSPYDSWQKPSETIRNHKSPWFLI